MVPNWTDLKEKNLGYDGEVVITDILVQTGMENWIVDIVVVT